ncbi:MAG: hypothetical protein R6X18_11105 [Chloroflexota bacterium]|jgi:hypothetical protein
MVQRRLLLLLTLLILSLAVGCGGDGMAVAPERVARDAVTARAFGREQCFLTFAKLVPAQLNPNPEQGVVDEVNAGEAPTPPAVALRGGSVRYQLTDGVSVWVDAIEYTTLGNCRS